MGFPGIEHYVPAPVYATLGRRLGDRDPGDLRVQTEECLKFLIIASESEPLFIPMTREVDEVWHELILQTWFYAELCARLPGGRFVHHQSIELDEYVAGPANPNLLDELMFWLPAYVSRFGDFTPERARYWSIVQYLHDVHGISLDAVNSAARVPC
ncbi:glycine-rich domain-containing protein [Actinophytocola sp. KF-1]